MHIIVWQLVVHIPLRTMVKLRFDNSHQISVGHLIFGIGLIFPIFNCIENKFSDMDELMS